MPRAHEKPKPSRQRMRFGRNVSQLRTQSGRYLSQDDLAEAVGVSSRYIQAIEAGDYWPSLPVLAKMTKALQCDWNKLMDGC